MLVYSKQINYRRAPRSLRGALFHDWQYLSMRVAAKTAYTSLRIILVYECNANIVADWRKRCFLFGYIRSRALRAY